MTDLDDRRRRSRSNFWVPALLGANALVFIAFGLQGNGWGSADSEALVRWSSNYGPRTLAGEPWRLASSMFLHGGAVHLIVNMITLWDLGRICEQLFGRLRFPVLYLVSGLAGSLASVYWNPMVNSVGASGAICGILSALLIFMLDARNRVPVAILKSHAAGMGIFLVYSIIMGIGDAPIDHAAHAGGLAAGALCAYILSPWRLPMPAVAGSVAMMIAIAALLKVAPGAAPERVEARNAALAFRADTRWFGQREAEMLALAQQLVPKWGQAETKTRLRDLAAQWDEAHARFTAYRFDDSAEQARLHRLLVQYIDQRRRAYRALVELPPNAGRDEFERLSREMKQTVDSIKELTQPR
ncbi:MAG: rhomboid family intramembrane serine protease [Betaproteobacteria bacterium]|nr:rhomboid family intramembrane serine protease [Betaproteobacteria bacterium]